MKRFLGLAFLLLLLGNNGAFSQKMDKENTNAKIKAVFIYNFTKYFEWPADYRTGNFVITVIGDLALYKELKEMGMKKSGGPQTFEIRTAGNLNEVERCHILFISSSYSNLLSEANVKMKGKNTLIITEKTGLAKMGAAINFVAVDNKQKFELNKKNAEKYGLLVSLNLEKLAILVD